MKQILLILTAGIILMQCTSSRWTVVNPSATDESEPPVMLTSSHKLLVQEEPTPSTPYFEAVLHSVQQLEYTQRVQVERTLQQYRPRWGFSLTSLLGGGLSFYAANSDLLVANPTNRQSLALNAAGLLLTTMAVTNLKPVGDAIYTGERRLLGVSGTIVQSDTVRVDQIDIPLFFDLHVSYEGDTLLSRSSDTFTDPELRVNLAALVRDRTITGLEPGEVEVFLRFNNEEQYKRYPVDTFMEPVVHIDVPATEIRNSPVITGRSSLTEVGSGSEFVYLGDFDDQWYEVQLGGSVAYVEKSAGMIQWRSADNGESPTIISIEEVPFGGIDVESFVPVLRTADSLDTAYLLHNHTGNQIGHRTYLERDLQLMELYFRNGFNLSQERIHSLDASRILDRDRSEELFPDSIHSAYLYITGYASVMQHDDGDGYRVVLDRLNEENEREQILLEEWIQPIARRTSGQLVLFIDLEFNHSQRPIPDDVQTNDRRMSALFQFSNRVLQLKPNSAILFSSGGGQASGLFAGTRTENMYHHIFPYYLAKGLQQRRTMLSELTRYLESQVDYTSRRLFDRAQEIHAFGNLTINLAD